MMQLHMRGNLNQQTLSIIPQMLFVWEQLIKKILSTFSCLADSHWLTRCKYCVTTKVIAGKKQKQTWKLKLRQKAGLFLNSVYGWHKGFSEPISWSALLHPLKLGHLCGSYTVRSDLCGGYTVHADSLVDISLLILCAFLCISRWDRCDPVVWIGYPHHDLLHAGVTWNK